MVQLKTIKDPTDLLVSFNVSQKTPKSRCSSCASMQKTSGGVLKGKKRYGHLKKNPIQIKVEFTC